MAMKKLVNYSDELTAEIKAKYTAGLDEGKTSAELVAVIAERVGKSKRSVISKLSREGVYVAAEKVPAAKREEGPTKKEMLRELESLVDFDVTGLENVTKAGLALLIAYAESRQADESAKTDESVQEAA